VVDEGRVVRLLRGIDERISRLAEERAVVASRRADPLWLDGIKYLFITAIEGCVDVAHHLAASERWGAADTNAAVFALLARHGVVSTESAGQLAAAVGLRNVLVHRYADVNDELVIAGLNELDDLTRFVQQVSSWLLAQHD